MHANAPNKTIHNGEFSSIKYQLHMMQKILLPFIVSLIRVKLTWRIHFKKFVFCIKMEYKK